MGAHLCSLRKRSRCEKLEEQQEPDEFSNVSHSSLAELLSSEYSNNEKTMKRSLSSTDSMDQTAAKVRRLTLQEWLLASPPTSSMSDNSTLGHGELYVFRNFTARVFPASPMMHDADLNSGEVTKSKTDIYPQNKNQTQAKPKKRVSFKLPQEADVIIFYSPKQELKAIQDLTILM